MKNGVVVLFRFFGFIVWTGVGICAGGLAGGAICARWVVADVTRRLPPPRDATWPMVLIFAFAGAILGVILAQVSVHLLFVKFRPVSKDG
jgi:hypothetical protein